jgi:hypothetical protein
MASKIERVDIHLNGEMVIISLRAFIEWSFKIGARSRTEQLMTEMSVVHCQIE